MAFTFTGALTPNASPLPFAAGTPSGQAPKPRARKPAAAVGIPSPLYLPAPAPAAGEAASGLAMSPHFHLPAPALPAAAAVARTASELARSAPIRLLAPPPAPVTGGAASGLTRSVPVKRPASAPSERDLAALTAGLKSLAFGSDSAPLLTTPGPKKDGGDHFVLNLSGKVFPAACRFGHARTRILDLSNTGPHSLSRRSFDYFSHLQELILRNALVDDSDLEFLFSKENLPDLQKLDVRGCGGITLRFIEELTRARPHLAVVCEPAARR